MPVDAAVFLGKATNFLSRIVMISQYVLSADFVPGSHQYLLTILSIWWCFGQLLGNLVMLSFVSASFTSTDYQQGGMASYLKLLLHIRCQLRSF